jgi:hypothetical protein
MADAAARAALKMCPVMAEALEIAGYDWNALDFEAIERAYRALLTPEESAAADVMGAEADALGRWTPEMIETMKAMGVRNVPAPDLVN